jgi:hypothetical protein
MDPVDVAWSILKAAFQPREGERLGAGMTQTVFGQEGNPDVVKVSDLRRNPAQLRAMYYNQLLSQIPNLRLFTGQQPMEQTASLPTDLSGMALPILSTQPRVAPLEGLSQEKGGMREDVIRGLNLQAGLHEAIPILEGLGAHDFKAQNLGVVPEEVGSQLTEMQAIGRGSQEPVRIHDPEFGEPGHHMPGRGLSGRVPGVDFAIPEHQVEDFGRQVDATPFERFIRPLERSYERFHGDDRASVNLLEDIIAEQERSQQDMLSHLGV